MKNRNTNGIGRTGIVLLALLTLVLGGCASGVRIGPGTATGAVVGGGIGAITNGSRGIGPGAAIGAGIGAIGDVLNGDQPISQDPPRRPAPQPYYDDGYYRRPAPRPYYDDGYYRRPAPRRVWDGYCGCWVLVR